MSDVVRGKYRILVYGTLMRGERNHHHMGQAELLVSNAVTKNADYIMQEFHSTSSPGSFSPGVKKVGAGSSNDGHIQGEVYEVDDEGLAAMDRLEQNGIHYNRNMVELNNGSKAWMYIHIDSEARAVTNPALVQFNSETKIYSWVRRA